jgi:hypothetical protein
MRFEIGEMTFLPDFPPLEMRQEDSLLAAVALQALSPAFAPAFSHRKWGKSAALVDVFLTLEITYHWNQSTERLHCE